MICESIVQNFLNCSFVLIIKNLKPRLKILLHTLFSRIKKSNPKSLKENESNTFLNPKGAIVLGQDPRQPCQLFVPKPMTTLCLAPLKIRYLRFNIKNPIA